MEEPEYYVYFSMPSHAHPGSRVDVPASQYSLRNPYAFIYDRNVVVLMDENTISRAELAVMMFRTPPNVTVIGSNSKGANGDIARLPLPGGITMIFTSIGVYTPDMGQTHRIGLDPDIRVTRTIQGIAEGRDELMEAAVEYLLSN